MEIDPRNVARQVGSSIRRRRAALAISQDELAARAGLHRTYVGAVERGERNITVLSLVRIAHALDTDPAQLLSADSD